MWGLGWRGGRGEDCWCFAWEAKTSSLWGDSLAAGMGGALHGGGKTGAVHGGVGGQRLVHWKGGVVGGKPSGGKTAGALRGGARRRHLLELGKPWGRKGERSGVIKTTSF